MHASDNSRKNTPSAALTALRQARLYGILDMGYVSPERMMDVAGDLLEGGVQVLQLRAKGYEAGQVIDLVREYAGGLLDLCRKYEVPFIVNDFPEVALELQSDGIHIGQDDGSLADVRAVVGDEMLVGRSTHSLEQARGAMDEGFDYIGFGPLFPTPTKKGRPGIGMESILRMQEDIGCQLPAFCIGGITDQNLDLVLDSGARRVVIVSALLQAEDVRLAVQRVRAVLDAV